MTYLEIDIICSRFFLVLKIQLSSNDCIFFYSPGTCVNLLYVGLMANVPLKNQYSLVIQLHNLKCVTGGVEVRNLTYIPKNYLAMLALWNMILSALVAISHDL